jgi:lipopolysaccharide export system protein LptA
MPAERGLSAFLVCLAVSALAAGPVSGQGLGLGTATDARPIEVTADSGIEWQQDAQVYVARGNAMAKRGTTEVHADTLTAHYRKAKGAEGGTEIYRLDADGHVRINNDKDAVVGDQAVYDVDRQIALITGKGLKLTTPTDVVTARDSLEWYDAQQVAVARGDAVAVRADRRIRADVLTAHMTKQKPPAAKPGETRTAQRTTAPPVKPAVAVKPGTASDEAAKEDSRISRVDAQGNVVVSTSTDIGRGDWGVYDADTGIVTLLGNVVITRGQNALRGQYAVVDLNRNVSRMMTLAAKPGAPAPRVEGIFVRQQPTSAAGSGATPGKPPAAKSKTP